MDLRYVVHLEEAVGWDPFLRWWVEVYANDCGVWVLIGDTNGPAITTISLVKDSKRRLILLSISSTKIDNVLGLLGDRSAEEWVLLLRLEDV